MSNQDALSDLLQRFAISALSRERKNEAVNEEILVGKYTGEFYIKSKDGIILSADISNREKSSTDEAVRIAELMGMTGDFYKVEFTNLMPKDIDYSVNIIQNDNITLPVDLKELLIYLDIDEFKINGDVAEKIYSNGDVKLLFEINVGGNVSYLRFNTKLQDVNYFLISFKDYTDLRSLKLIDITISKDNEEKRVMLLHNMFVTVNK